MGGVFSGRVGARGGKPAVDTLPCVKFGRRGALNPFLPQLALERPDLGVVRFGPMVWYVHLGTTSPHFGGKRRWLVCPRCARRRSALYVEKTALACRTCLNLRYPSQHENERDRMLRRAHLLREENE